MIPLSKIDIFDYFFSPLKTCANLIKFLGKRGDSDPNYLLSEWYHTSLVAVTLLTSRRSGRECFTQQSHRKDSASSKFANQVHAAVLNYCG